MPMPSDRRDASTRFARLGNLARAVANGQVPSAVGALGEHRVAKTFDKARRTPARRRLTGLATAFAMMAAGVVVSSRQLSKSSLSWTVDGSSATDSRYISPQTEREATV